MVQTTLPTVTLMHPTLVTRPFHREGLVYEEKVDGYRMVAYKAADRSVKLVSRQGVDHTSRFPDIVAALRALAQGDYRVEERGWDPRNKS